MVSWRQRADDEQIVASFLQSVRASRARTPGTFRAQVSAIGPCLAYSAGSALIRSPPCATGMTQSGVESCDGPKNVTYGWLLERS